MILLTKKRAKFFADKLCLLLYKETLQGTRQRNNILNDRINYWQELFAKSVLNGSIKWATDYLKQNSNLICLDKTDKILLGDADEVERIIHLFEKMRKLY